MSVDHEQTREDNERRLRVDQVSGAVLDLDCMVALCRTAIKSLEAYVAASETDPTQVDFACIALYDVEALLPWVIRRLRRVNHPIGP